MKSAWRSNEPNYTFFLGDLRC